MKNYLLKKCRTFDADGFACVSQISMAEKKKNYTSECELLTETEKKQDTVQKLGDQKPDQIAFYSWKRNHKPHKKKDGSAERPY